MRLPRLYTDKPLWVKSEVHLPANQAHYLLHVLRMHDKDQLVLFNGTGGEYIAEIKTMHKNTCICDIHAFHPVEREMGCRVHIVQCAGKTGKVETVLQKATELGVAGIQITVSERSALKLQGERLTHRMQRWQQIIIEAAEQSGRTRIPTLSWCTSPQNAALHGHAYILHPDAAYSWHEARPQLATASSATFLIGPEGGWSASDLESIGTSACKPLNFSPRIMRMETVATAILAAVQAIQDRGEK